MSAFFHVFVWTALLIATLGVQALAADFQGGEKAYYQGDYAEALRVMRPLAEQGHPGAQFRLGFMYANSRGVPRNDAEAVKWYRKSAWQGHSSAQNNLGFMYDKGRGGPQDAGRAAKWYRAAAEQGHAKAQNNLGLMYADGRGVPRDYVKAVKWYRAAAEQGHADAQATLGTMYQLGLGASQDDAEAAKWYRRAAEQGHAGAKNRLDSITLRSDDSYAMTCTRLLTNVDRSTTDPIDTATLCEVIINSYAAGCIETVVAGFIKYPVTSESVYDGIDTNHVIGCTFFDRRSSVECLNFILSQRRPTVDDIIACADPAP